MCFAVSIIRPEVLSVTESTLEGRLSVPLNDIFPVFPDYYFISAFDFPTLPVIKEQSVDLCQWGLVPSWCTNDYAANDMRTKTLNAAGETIFEKPVYKEYIATQRCLLPVSGFFEWRNFRGVKYPYYIYPKDGTGFLLGAVFNKWVNPQTEQTRNTFSIITTPANELMTRINNIKKRMPLIISTNRANEWLDSDVKPDTIAALIQPAANDIMTSHTISKTANSPMNFRNTPEITEPVIYTDLTE